MAGIAEIGNEQINSLRTAMKDRAELTARQAHRVEWLVR